MNNPKLPWIIAIGASGAEGLDDLTSLLSRWHTLDAIVMIVLHRPWDRLSNLRLILERAAHLPVIVADQGEDLVAGKIYIGEPDSHLTLVANSFGKLISDPSRLYKNRTVDLLFQSLAEVGGERTIGVVLSGSLDDGSRGLAAIHTARGRTMAISAGTPGKGSPGMPANAISFDGPVDVIGDVERIASEIQATVMR